MGLYNEYGVDEFSQRIVGASIMYQGTPCYTYDLTANPDGGYAVRGYFMTGNIEKPVKKPVLIPVAYYEDMKSLSFPPLGYRSAAAGQYLTYMSRIPSATKKGLHVSQIRASLSNLSLSLQAIIGFNTDYFESSEARTMLALTPSYTSWMDGLRKVKDGEIISFVVDENFACAPSYSADRYLDILYRERRIGSISKDGDVSISSKQATTAWRQVTEGKSS